MQDYTIDYEEYYNRQMVWCVEWWGTGENFTWEIWLSWYCTNFTAYWNENSTQRCTDPTCLTITWEYHDIYKCSSQGSYNGSVSFPRVVYTPDCWKFWYKQSFGQYATLFTDVKEATRKDDDEELWKILGDLTGAIVDANNIQELYLISHDWKKRLFFRRRLVAQGWGSAQYKIQILRLRWFDAGQNHTFSGAVDEWSYDRQIDTRACDTSMWFEWSWSDVWWAYSGYHLPSDIDDCRVDLTYGNTNVSTWNLIVSPINDPDLYWADDSHQINPYIKMLIVNSVYSPLNSGNSITEFKIPIETTINMKSFYKE